MRRLGYRADAVVEALHAAQSSFGFLGRDALEFVAASLRVPPSRVYGVATFYSYFSLEPQGEHTCVVCLGTACYISGAPKLVDAASAALGIEPGETTDDGRVSLLTAHCVGACSVAPVAVLDGDVHGKLTPDALVEAVGWCQAPSDGVSGGEATAGAR